MGDVFVIGAAATPLGKHLDRTVKSLSAQAVADALADAGVERRDIEAAWFCNTRQGVLEGQHGIRGQCSLRADGFERLAIFNIDNACASSTAGLYQAYAAVRAGLADIALVVGAEKMNYPERRKEMFEAFKGSWDRDLADAHLAALLALGEGLDVPAGVESAPERSVFMDIYAAQARFHMRRFGTTPRQIASVAAKNHWHSQWNPLAQYRTPMTVDEVLADKMISWPMTRSMCAPMSDGAGALVVASEKAVQRLGATKRAVRIRGIAIASGMARAPDDDEHHITHLAAMQAYERAGVGPSDISLAEMHDASAIAEIIHIEHVGFCDTGSGGALVESGATHLGGRLPINVSGGLLSKGHPIGATGALMIHDLVRQLRGEAGAAQVSGARLGLAENGGGFYGVEEAVCAVTILEAP
ncbi:thiolase family protein [Variovorax sp. PBL-E5]|uniref:thiolase family protein n=1 Tax=Variovorax sp. PBL-E5 TaxID=434014 RepID=UPI0013175E11|nr:thiolase family protein [Variovorax sp. PBL-E5]VTU46008.1 3-ketoacyl-CoA thiolase [Variovorax sp. PBL-E5]